MSIVEVAKAAGVSTATVSRVLNGLPGVKAETIAQVQAAVTELSYKPQRVHNKKKPRGFQRKKLKTGNIAVITVGHDSSWLGLPVLAAVVGGIQRGTQFHDLRLLLGDMEDLTKVSPLLTSRQVDGAIVFLSSEVPTSRMEQIFQSMQQHVPIVWAMGMGMMVGGVDHVMPDNVSIGHMAYTHLAQQHCDRLAFLTANPEWPLMRLRGQAFTNIAIDGGHAPVVYMVAQDKRVAEPYGPRVVMEPTLERLIKRLAESRDRPNGLFVSSDMTTSHVYPLLARHKITVGHDLKIVSCDNEEPRLLGLHPRPPSIDIGSDEVGFRAVNRLLNRIERPNGPALVIQVSPRMTGTMARQ
jgi:LacI family transcriptional regulator